MHTRRLIARLKLISAILAICLVVTIAGGVYMKISYDHIIAELRGNTSASFTVTGENDYPATAGIADDTLAAAEFDGGTVSVGEAREAYAAIKVTMDSLGIPESDYAEESKTALLDSLIEPQILKAKAQEFGVYELTAEQQAEIEATVSADFEAIIAEWMEYRFDDDLSEDEVRSDTIAYLRDNGYDYDTLLNDAKQQAWQDNLKAFVVKDIKITDENLRDYYNSKIETDKMRYASDFGEYDYDREVGNTIVWNPEGVRTVQAILIGFDGAQVRAYLEFQSALENGDSSKLENMDELYAEILPEAQEVMNRIRNGEDFLSLMDEYSVDSNLALEPNRSTGYYISSASTNFNQTFVDAAMALQKIGDISDFVYVDGGIYILRYASDVPAGAVPFEDVRDRLYSECSREMIDAKYNDTVSVWMKEAHIVYHTDRF